jgi:type I restriction enzyme S subunit
LRTERLKHIAEVRVSNVDKKTVDGEVPVKLCNYTDVYYNERITAALGFMNATATADQRKTLGLRPGDVLLTKDSETADDIGVSALVVDDIPDLVCGYHLAVVRPRPEVAYGPYLRWVVAGNTARQAMATAATGVTRFGLRSDAIADLEVPLPPLEEQRAAAEYLDRETARIDELIDAKRRMIDLLDERRVAIAHETVTGATLAGRRQPSGVPWLGSIPAHWRMVRLGSSFDVQLGRMLNAERSTGPYMRRYVRNINVRWGSVDTSDLAEMSFPPSERSRYALRAGDLLVNEGGAGIGRAAIWDGRIAELYYQKSVHRIRPRGPVGVRWLLEWLYVAVDRSVFQVEGNLATIPHVPAEALREYRLPFPPASEAEDLLLQVNAAIDRDNALRRLAETQVALLIERRQALVTAAVTSQLQVSVAA